MTKGTAALPFRFDHADDEQRVPPLRFPSVGMTLQLGMGIALENALIENRAEIAAVATLRYPGDQLFQAGGVDPAQTIGYFFGTGNLEALALFDGLDENCGFNQRVVGPGIEPGEASTQDLGTQLASLQIPAIDIGNLQFAARRRRNLVGYARGLAVKKIKPRDRVSRFWLIRLLFDV